MPVQLPAGFRPVSRSAIVEMQDRLQPVDDPAFRDSPRIPDPIASRNSIARQIAQHRRRSSAERERMQYRLPQAAHSGLLSDAAPLYHVRDPDMNRTEFFFATFETEKPNVDEVRALPERQQAFYANRHVGKRGRDLYTDEPIEGPDSLIGKLKSSPHLHAQSQDIRCIRGEAATATIDGIGNITKGKEHFLHRLHAHILERLDPDTLRQGATVHLVRPTRDHYAIDATLNFFAFCTQTEIAESLNVLERAAAKASGRPPVRFTDHKTCISLSRTARTEASPIGRLVQQHYFTTDDIARGDRVVIVDDHAQAGGCILAMGSALKSAGADILAVAALTAHPFCRSLALDERVAGHLHAVMERWDPQGRVWGALAGMGLHPDTMTSMEAMILIACVTDPSGKDACATPERFRELERHLARGNHVLEGANDSLDPVPAQLPPTPEDVLQEIANIAAESRGMAVAAPVRRIEWISWEGAVSDDARLRYRLLANALTIAGQRHAGAHPAILQIAGALQPFLSGEGYSDGLPRLCMGEEAGFLTASGGGSGARPLSDKDLLDDLMERLSAIAPDIALDPAEQERIVRIVETECRRQYKTAIRLRTVVPRPAQVSDERDERISSKEQSGSGLPFPDVRAELAAGARAFLDRLRKSDARLIAVSSKENNDLENEINTLGVAHYFDAACGSMQRPTHAVAMTAVQPPSRRIQEALDALSLSHRTLARRYWDSREEARESPSFRPELPARTS